MVRLPCRVLRPADGVHHVPPQAQERDDHAPWGRGYGEDMIEDERYRKGENCGRGWSNDDAGVKGGGVGMMGTMGEGVKLDDPENRDRE